MNEKESNSKEEIKTNEDVKTKINLRDVFWSNIQELIVMCEERRMSRQSIDMVCNTFIRGMSLSSYVLENTSKYEITPEQFRKELDDFVKEASKLSVQHRN